MAYTYRGQLSPPSISQSYWNGTTWSVPSISSGNSPASLGIRQGIDPVETGSWDRRSLRINSVKIIRETAACPSISFDFKPHPSWGIRLSGNIIAAFWVDPGVYLPSALTFSDTTAAYAVQKSLAKTSRAAFDAGTNLGELRETLEMLRAPLKGLRDFLKYHQRKQGESLVKYSRRISDASANTWLEYRYGIRPLILTIEDLLKAYRDGLGAFDVNRLYKKTSKVSFNKGDRTFRSVDFTSFVGQQIITSASSESYHSGVFYRYDKLPTTQELLGFDMTSLPGIALELTKLSFVWDWFIGVGNWIEGLRAQINRTVAGAYVSHKVVKHVQIGFSPNSVYVSGQPTWKPPDTYSSSTYNYKAEMLERKPMSLSGIYLPGLNPKDLGIAKQLDSLTLLWQRLPRR